MYGNIIIQGVSWWTRPEPTALQTLMWAMYSQHGGDVLIGNQLHEPDTGVVTVFGSLDYSTVAPGRRPQPGERQHPIVLHDSDKTVLETLDTESDGDTMMPEAVIWAANLVNEFKRQAGTDIDSLNELGTKLVELANTIDAEAGELRGQLRQAQGQVAEHRLQVQAMQKECGARRRGTGAGEAGTRAGQNWRP